MDTSTHSPLIEHLSSRRFDTRLHRVWLGDCVVTVPLYNLSGQIVGTQQYRPGASKDHPNDRRLGRYFTRNPAKHVAVWGLESWKQSNTLFVCEGIFSACAVTWLGYSAIAVLSFDVDASTVRWLNMLRSSRPTVALLDRNASALAKYTHTSYQSGDYDDPGDYPTEYLADICTRFSKK